MGWTRFGTVLVCSLALCLVAASASAAGDSKQRRAALKHYDAGNKLYTAKDFEGAKVEFQAAWDIVDAPEFLFNLAQCERNLGHHAEAVKLYGNFLERKPDASNRARVEEYIAEEQKLIPPEKPVETEQPKAVVAPPPPPPPPPPPAEEPIYKKKWFLYAAIGAGAAVVLVLVIGLSVGLSGTVGTELGTRDLALFRF